MLDTRLIDMTVQFPVGLSQRRQFDLDLVI